MYDAQLSTVARVTVIVPALGVHLGGLSEKIYLPIQVGKKQTDVETASQWQLKVRFNSEITEFYYQIIQIKGNSKQKKAAYQTLGLGYYPAKVAFSIPLQDITEPGLYRIGMRISKIRKSNSPSGHNILIYIP